MVNRVGMLVMVVVVTRHGLAKTQERTKPLDGFGRLGHHPVGGGDIAGLGSFS